jgi:hypothetical protein
VMPSATSSRSRPPVTVARTPTPLARGAWDRMLRWRKRTRTAPSAARWSVASTSPNSSTRSVKSTTTRTYAGWAPIRVPIAERSTVADAAGGPGRRSDADERARDPGPRRPFQYSRSSRAPARRDRGGTTRTRRGSPASHRGLDGRLESTRGRYWGHRRVAAPGGGHQHGPFSLTAAALALDQAGPTPALAVRMTGGPCADLRQPRCW